ncbi:MAG: DUF4339 domain-containing protein, partial [Planctomycetaceae bacterium]|nr:DUF4339 domain-containing protein [Planctomycetaceae bacterium]
MTKRFYYIRNNSKQGPFSASELRALASTGEVTRDTVILDTQLKRKLRAGQIKQLFESPAKVRSNRQSGKPANTNEVVIDTTQPPVRSLSTSLWKRPWAIALGAVAVVSIIGVIYSLAPSLTSTDSFDEDPSSVLPQVDERIEKLIRDASSGDTTAQWELADAVISQGEEHITTKQALEYLLNVSRQGDSNAIEMLAGLNEEQRSLVVLSDDDELTMLLAANAPKSEVATLRAARILAARHGTGDAEEALAMITERNVTIPDDLHEFIAEAETSILDKHLSENTLHELIQIDLDQLEYEKERAVLPAQDSLLDEPQPVSTAVQARVRISLSNQFKVLSPTVTIEIAGRTRPAVVGDWAWGGDSVTASLECDVAPGTHQHELELPLESIGAATHKHFWGFAHDYRRLGSPGRSFCNQRFGSELESPPQLRIASINGVDVREPKETLFNPDELLHHETSLPVEYVSTADLVDFARSIEKE